MRESWRKAGQGVGNDLQFDWTIEPTTEPIVFGGYRMNETIYWDDPSGKLSPTEFENPGKIDPAVIRELGWTRLRLGRPIYPSKPYHPQGDAVPFDATSHSEMSLHKWGVDHVASSKMGHLVPDAQSLGLAVDWDCGDQGAEELFSTYLDVSRTGEWTGIGLYPAWNRPGFHTDLRPKNHPSYKAHWFQGYDGVYYPLRWKLYKGLALG